MGFFLPRPERQDVNGVGTGPGGSCASPQRPGKPKDGILAPSDGPDRAPGIFQDVQFCIALTMLKCDVQFRHNERRDVQCAYWYSVPMVI